METAGVVAKQLQGIEGRQERTLSGQTEEGHIWKTNSCEVRKREINTKMLAVFLLLVLLPVCKFMSKR